MTTTPQVFAELSALENTRELDLEEARNIQGMMLPAEPLCTDEVIIAHEFQPAAEVGGDFLDYFSLADESVGLYLGDVCGKGLPAALYAALAVGTLRGVHKTGQLPAGVLNTLNRRLTIRGLPRRYATLQYAVFHPGSGTMHIASAGITGPLHVFPGGCSMLELPGLPPGMFAHAAYETTTLQLAPGDAMVFCTDGILEAMNASDESFGTERLCNLCHGRQGETANALLARIFAAVEEFTHGCAQHDDMTATVFRYLGPVGPGASTQFDASSHR